MDVPRKALICSGLHHGKLGWALWTPCPVLFPLGQAVSLPQDMEIQPQGNQRGLLKKSLSFCWYHSLLFCSFVFMCEAFCLCVFNEDPRMQGRREKSESTGCRCKNRAFFSLVRDRT